jgi:hypothetical protein
LAGVNFSSALFIGEDAFSYCEKLEQIDLPLAQNINAGAFSSCDNITNITLPSAISIGHAAFLQSGHITEINLPLATTINDYAFWMCSFLTSLDLSSVTALGGAVFDSCYSEITIKMGDIPPTIHNDFLYGYVKNTINIQVPALVVDTYQEWEKNNRSKFYNKTVNIIGI